MSRTQKADDHGHYLTNRTYGTRFQKTLYVTTNWARKDRKRILKTIFWLHNQIGSTASGQMNHKNQIPKTILLAPQPALKWFTKTKFPKTILWLHSQLGSQPAVKWFTETNSDITPEVLGGCFDFGTAGNIRSMFYFSLLLLIV